LNTDEVTKVRRFGNRENFVGKREKLVFDAFIDSEPVKTAYRMGRDLMTVKAGEFWIKTFC